jgi:hypothetical protein
MATPKETKKLILVTRKVIAGPPGTPRTLDSWESEESLKRLEHKPRTR